MSNSGRPACYLIDNIQTEKMEEHKNGKNIQADQSIADIYTTGHIGLCGRIHWVDPPGNPLLENIIYLTSKI